MSSDAAARTDQLRIVVLADSLALPRREEPDLVSWDETWPRVLARSLKSAGVEAEVLNHGARNRTMDTLQGGDFQEHILLKEPEVVILQVGVCDCAPRLFTRRARRLLQNRLVPSSLRQWIIRRRSSQRGKILARNPLARVYTQPEQYNTLLEQFLNLLKQCEVPPRCVILPIVANSELMEQISPGHTANCHLYNGYLAAACAEHGATWISPEQVLGGTANVATYFCTDGYHLSPEGNRRVGQVVAEALGVRSRSC